MSLRVVVLALALMLAAAALAILAHRDVPVESVVARSDEGVEPAASSPEPAPGPDAGLVPESDGSTDFGITEEEFNEFQNTLLRSLNDEFRTSIDENVKTSWDASTPEADESRREALRQLHEEAK